MAIRSYHKSTKYSAPTSVDSNQNLRKPFGEPSLTDLRYPESTPHNRITMWAVLVAGYDIAKKIVASSNIAGLIIPAGLILAGVGFIYLQFQPTIADTVLQYSGYYDQGSTTLVSGNYITDRLQYVSNPGADYFQSVSDMALNQTYKPDTFSQNYRNTMYLTIPSLGFNRLPITPNVQSNSKEIYNQVLSSSLAHFKGTGLPASDVDGNTVIYGHSAAGSYNPSPSDVLAAFSFLKDLRVGDKIIIEMDGKDYTYRMSQSKIIQPEDVSIISSTPGRSTLTLFTCFPPGNNSQRLVVTAIPAN